jgi:NDP-sugar pyrophosphorylase family protein
MKAMLLAAGLGTRLKPFTDKHSKALAVVNGKTLLQRNIVYLQQFGIYDVIVNVHHFAEQIIETIKEQKGFNSNVTVSDETDAILETGGGLKRAGWYFKEEESFVLMNVDILTDLRLNEMIFFHNQNKPLATLATTNRKTSRYFLFDKKNQLCGWRNIKTGEEKPPQSLPFPASGEGRLVAKAFSGIHIINSKIFALMQPGEVKFSMVDVYLSLCSHHNILSFDHSYAKFIDAGSPENLIAAQELFK